MPQQTVTVNGRTYILYPVETYTVNPDYLPTLNNVQVGMLQWAGNGETHFNYHAYDMLQEFLGDFPDYVSAVGGLDAKLYPGV